jgi:hypothetical protein
MELEIWQEAIDIAGSLFDLADKLEDRRTIALPNSCGVPASPCQIILPKVLAVTRSGNL